MDLVSKAIIFATKAHHGMKRKNSELPFIIHPLEVAIIISTMTNDQEVVAAGLLHDVVEDANISLDEINQEFGSNVCRLVASETEDKRKELPSSSTWQIRKEESLNVLKEAALNNDYDVLKVWLGDKLSNMRSIYQLWTIKGHKLWENFNQKDPCKQAWYYQKIATLTQSLCSYRAWKEYNELINIVFKKGN